MLHGSRSLICGPRHRGHLVLAAAVGMLAYMHHLWSRADLMHLCNVGQPLVIVLAGLSIMFLPPLMVPVILTALIGLSLTLFWPTAEFQLQLKGPSELASVVTAHETI